MLLFVILLFLIFSTTILHDNDQDPVSGDTDSDTDSISDVCISTITDASIIRKSNFLLDFFDMSKITNLYPHPCHHGRRIGQCRTHTVKKRLNSVSAYKQQLTAFAPPVVPLDHLPVTPYLILACLSVVLKIESAIQHIHVSTVPDDASLADQSKP